MQRDGVAATHYSSIPYPRARFFFLSRQIVYVMVVRRVHICAMRVYRCLPVGGFFLPRPRVRTARLPFFYIISYSRFGYLAFPHGSATLAGSSDGTILMVPE